MSKIVLFPKTVGPVIANKDSSLKTFQTLFQTHPLVS